ncbi:MAG: hypothetical protein ABIN01_07060 [Ferruginibacter sp.]
MKIERPVETEADSDLQAIVTTSASVASNRLLAAGWLMEKSLLVVRSQFIFYKLNKSTKVKVK